MNIISNYKKLNNSFKKELIFHLGAEQGFYSEFNNMVFAIIYCLKYEYKFILYSGDANFKIEKGWQDFFEPFCKETNFFLHKKINKRHFPPNLSKKSSFLFKIYRLLNKNTYLTYELWDKFFNENFEREIFDIPQLGIRGNLRDASRIIVEMIYKFNYSTKTEISELVHNLNLPSEYLAVNVRRGDKDTEFKFIDTSSYIKKLQNVSIIKNIFVFTDDYEVIENLSQYKDYSIFSLVNKSEKGYIHGDFLKLSVSEKRYLLIKMFAAIELVCKSNYAVGTFTTNPGLFFGMRMSENKFFSLQKSSWFQFEMKDVQESMVFNVLGT